MAQERVEYYHLDAVGNVRVVTDESGNVIERHDHMPFGEEVCGTPPHMVPCASIPAGQTRRFTGKERDPETGLDYVGARYYGSRIGRFTTVDPVLDQKAALVDPQRWNRYAYGLNNPLRYVDPDGRSTLRLSPEYYARNRAIRSAIAEFLKWDPFPQDHALGAMLMGGLPTNDREAVQSLVSAAFGMVAPLERAAFAQRTFSEEFSLGGKFAGRTVDDVAVALRAGELKPADVPIDYVVRDGNTLILSTRWAQALERAGVPRSGWSATDRTGQAA